MVLRFILQVIQATGAQFVTVTILTRVETITWIGRKEKKNYFEWERFDFHRFLWTQRNCISSLTSRIPFRCNLYVGIDGVRLSDIKFHLLGTNRNAKSLKRKMRDLGEKTLYLLFPTYFEAGLGYNTFNEQLTN